MDSSLRTVDGRNYWHSKRKPSFWIKYTIFKIILTLKKNVLLKKFLYFLITKNISIVKLKKSFGNILIYYMVYSLKYIYNFKAIA